MKGLLVAGITRQLSSERHTLPELCLGHPFTDIRRLRAQDQFPKNVDVLVFVPQLGLLSETNNMPITPTWSLQPVTIPDGYSRVCIYVTEAQWQDGLWSAVACLSPFTTVVRLKGSPGQRMKELLSWLDKTRELGQKWKARA